MDVTLKRSSDTKKPSRWNSRKIIQKLSNAGKIQISAESKSREIQRKFRSLVIATRAIYRAPKFLTISLDFPKSKPEKQVQEIQSDGKLKTSALQGIVHVKFDYDADVPSINTICCDEYNDIWIGCWNRQPLCNLSTKEKIESKQNFDTTVSDMTSLPSGDILLTKFGECSIKTLSKTDGSIKTFKSFAPLYPEGIHTTAKGEIFVTVVDETSYLVNRNTTRKVVKLSESGKVIKDIEYGDHGLKLFILPYRITENVNGDICVVNRTGQYLGQVVVLDKDGKFKFTYDGNPVLPCNDFIPMGIACDKNGCIIITDPNDFAIHILDKCGVLIQYLESSTIGIGPPMSVCVDRTGLLWVGSMTNETKLANKSKLYALC